MKGKYISLDQLKNKHVYPGTRVMAVFGKYPDRYCGGKSTYAICLADQKDSINLRITESAWETHQVGSVHSVGKHSIYVFREDPPEQLSIL